MEYHKLPKMIQSAHYQVNVSWEYLKETLNREFHDRDIRFELDPDYQRGHVWTEKQQIAYIEFKLKKGSGSNILLFNCPGWMSSFKGPYELVDGKQRLTAVLAFLDNKIPAFGYYYQEFTGRIPYNCDFIWCVNNLPTRAEVLQWYVEINSGGIAHTKEEINKVKRLLKNETK